MSRINQNVLNLIRTRITLENRTITELAPLCQVSVPYLSMGLRGERTLSNGIVETLITVLNLRPEIQRLALMEPMEQELSTEMILNI